MGFPIIGKPKIDNLPGIMAWFDGGDSATITVTGAGVSLWEDKSGTKGGSKRDAAQSTDADRPGYSPGDYGLAFDGTEWLATTATDLLQNVSEYTVYRAYQVNAACADFARVIAVDNGSSRPFRDYLIPGPPRRMRTYSNLSGGGNITSENGAGGDPEDVRLVKSSVFTASNGTVTSWLNGVQDETQNTGASENTANITGALGIGARANGDSDLNGRIMEVIICHAAHSDRIRQKVENHLMRKWNISG